MNAAKDLSPLKRAYLALEQMQARCRELEQTRSEAIAVVGMACRLPGGADHPEAYWRLLRSGVDAVSDVPPGRWDVDALYDPDPAAPGKMCTRRGGFLQERIDEFDPQFFSISPREAETMDPQQRLLLEVGWEALENAAQVEERLARSSTGVFVGMTSHDFSDFHLAGQGLRRMGTHIITGNTHNAAAGRLSYCFGFQGPCLAVDTACSSSLVAAHLACQSLLRNECRRALAGGVNLILSPAATIAMSQGRVLAPDGLCRAFDAAASGMVRGEGCAFVVLKRLSHALEDGDNVLALIRGTAVNQDGPSSGLTVPNGPAQEAVIRQALAGAGLKPGDIDYVEAHGTGTPLGDPIELRALAGVFGTDRDRPLVVGSVKTNIGHLEACAGVASLLKVMLALENREIPPHLHFRDPTPHLPWEELPLVVPTETRPWPAGSRPRLAGVSSFGFSGVNAHVVLQEAPAPQPPEETTRDRPLHLFTLSGRSEQALRHSAERFAAHLGRHPDLALGNVCFSAGAGRAHASHRLGLAAGSLSEARDHLAAFAGGRPLPGLEQRCSETPSKVAFLFTGQGSQYAGMGRELYEAQPAFRRSLQRCDEILRPHLPRSLLDVLFAAPAEPLLLEETAYAQPALFTLEYALAELWRSWGVQPAVVLGHSVGEYAAACVAGLFSLEAGLALVAERARLIQELPRDGAMAAIFAAPAEVEAAIRPHAASVTVAAYNGPENVVISGRNEAVSAVLSKFAAAGVKTQGLRVSHAFHSPLMDPILDAFEAKVRAVSFATPTIGLISNLHGGPAAPDMASAGYWRRHLRQPVRFADGVKAAREKGCTVFLELGPRPTLLGLSRQSLESEDLAWLASLRPGQPDWRPMLESLAALYVRGVRIDWPGFEQGRRRRRVALPTTPFQRQRCWPETPAGRTDGAAFGGPGRGQIHPLLGGPLALAGTSDLRFESRIGRDAPVYLQDHCVFDHAILPAAGYLEMALAAAGVFGTDGVVLENVAFQHALKLPEDAERIVQTVLKPDGADAFTFEIYSRSEDAPDQPWVRHTAGRLVRPDPTPAGAPEDPALLVTDAGEAVDVDALYRQCRARGVGLGPRFQALKRAWRQDRAALGEIELPTTLAPGVAEYHLHPVLLDAAFQAMGAVFASHGGTDVYLPVALDRVRVYRRGGAAGWSQLRVEPIQGAREQSLRVDLSLLSAEGHLVAVLEGLHLKRASREQLQGHSSEPHADWLYAVEWLARNPEDPHAGPDYWPDAGEIGGTILPSLARDLALPPEAARYGAFFEDIEDAAVDYIVAAFRRLGWEFPSGQRISTDALAARFGVIDRQRRLFERLLGILGDVGMLVRRSDSEWEVASLANHGDGADGGARLFREYPEAAAELTLLQRCGERLADVLRGECDPLGLLFPEGEPVTAANLYGDSPGARAANGTVRRLVRSLLERLPEDRRVRILEIGAGTGGTTSHLLDELPAERTDYVFTDISPLFVHRAAEKFSAYPFLRFSVLDIEEPPVGHGFEPGGYDLVVAANVLHATRDLRRSLHHVRELLAPGGLLVLLEGTAPLRFIDLIFGLTEGWWHFADPDLRPAHPLLSAERWKSLLEESGFRHAGAVASPRETGDVWSTQALIVARAMETEPAAVMGAGPRGWLILAPEGSALAEGLRQQVKAAGDLATLAYPGRHYERTEAGDFRIDPASPADFRRLVDESAAEWRAPLARIVHLWATAPAPEAGLASANLETANVLGCGAALHLVQAALCAGEAASPELWLATRGAQLAASGQGLPGLAGSTLWGFGKVATLEFPELRCVRVDLDGDDDRAALSLYGEIRGGSAEDQVAFRGGRRYVARLVRHAGERRDFSVRPDGTYLITGGHRGLGLETAKWLVEQGARALVLLGRGDAKADAETGRELASLRRAGAVVEAVRADVADAGQVAGVIAHIDAHLPPLRGIVHSAGVLDDGILAQQSFERFQRVLAPKMLGAWNLHALTKSHALDFFVLYSSLASLLGSAGQANHSAANAFLDALAHHRRALGLPGLSINWGVWSDIGAAVRHRVGQRVKAQGMGTISPGQGMRILGALLAQNGAQVGVAPIDWPVFAQLSKAGRKPPFFANFADRRPAAEASRPGGAVDLALELCAAPAAEREARVEAHLRVQVAGVLRLAPDEVSIEQPLNRIGLDSLMAVELRNRLRSQLSLDVPLVKFMEDRSIRCLASELGAQLAEAGSAGPDRRDPEPNRSAPPVSLEAEPLLARLDQLTDDEVDALLAAELAEHADHVSDEGRP